MWILPFLAWWNYIPRYLTPCSFHAGLCLSFFQLQCCACSLAPYFTCFTRFQRVINHWLRSLWPFIEIWFRRYKSTNGWQFLPPILLRNVLHFCSSWNLPNSYRNGGNNLLCNRTFLVHPQALKCSLSLNYLRNFWNITFNSSHSLSYQRIHLRQLRWPL